MDGDRVEDGRRHEDESDVERDVHGHERADSHEPRQRQVCIGMDGRADDVVSIAQRVFHLLTHLHLVAAGTSVLLCLLLLLGRYKALHLFDLRRCLEGIHEPDARSDGLDSTPVRGFVESRLSDTEADVFLLSAH